MNVKKIKSVGKRSISMLLSVLMVISLFTVCMVSTTVTAGAWQALSGVTMYFDNSVTNWSKVYINVIKTDGNVYSYYEMSVHSGSIYKYTFSNTEWYDRDRMRFTPTNGSYDAYSADLPGIESSNLNGKLYTPKGTGGGFGLTVTTYDGTSGGGSGSGGDPTTPDYSGTHYLVDASLYNYRNQSLAYHDTDFPDGAAGQASQIWNPNVYLQYNTAVADWFRYNKDNRTDTSKGSTPLYQGNFRASGSVASGESESGTIDYVKSGGLYSNLFYHFVSVANGANRYNSVSTGSAAAVATNLVDKKLNSDNNITQNGIELPQFSSAFMERYNKKTVTGVEYVPNKSANLGSGDFTPTGVNTNKNYSFCNIQSEYKGLHFPFEITNNGKNTVYTYDADTHNNRFYNGVDFEIYNSGDGKVYGCKNELGHEGKAGYYPFNKDNPSTKDNVINCFGTRFDILFTMPKKDANGAQTLNGEDLTFKFDGDDDVWVYIDGYLALDLGGSHNIAKGEINLTDKNSTIKTGYYKSSYNDISSSKHRYSGIALTSSGSKTFNWTGSGSEEYLNELAKSLEDTNKLHTLTVFYLERGTFDSNFRMEFMLPAVDDSTPDTITVNQNLDTSDVNPGLVEKTNKSADNDVFNVQLQTNSSDASENIAKYPIAEAFKRGETTLQAAGSTSGATGVPFDHSLDDGSYTTAGGTTFTWTNKSSSNNGTGKVSDNGEVQLLYDQSAIFSNQFALNSKMTLTQLDAIKKFNLTGTNTAPPTTSETLRKVSDYYTSSYVLTDTFGNILSQSADSATIPEFSVHNEDPKQDLVTALTANITNKVKVGSVSFTKKLEANENADDVVFKFKFYVSNVFGEDGPVSYSVPIGTTYTISDGTTTTSTEITESNQEIEIEAGDTVTITGIPVGTKYKIEEIGENDANQVFGVSRIELSNGISADYVVDRQDSSNGVAGTVSTKSTGNTNTVGFDIYNSSSTTEVVYRYFDRDTTSGLPTLMNTKYTYFTRKLPGGNVTADTVVEYAPNIINVLSSYSLEPANVNMSYTLTSSDIANSINPDCGLVADKQYIVATYSNSYRSYTATFDYLPLYTDGSKRQRTVSLTKKFNELVTNGDKITTAKTNNQGKRFLYWAKLVDVSGTNTGDLIYTPVSADYRYSYRITDNIIVKAVYDGDVNLDGKAFDELDGTVTDGQSSHPTGEGSGYGASAAERTYDSYFKGELDYTRVNVTFGAVGSPDNDTKISQVGYIVVKNKNNYAPNSNFDNSALKQIVQNNITTPATTATITGKDSKNYAVLFGNFAVDNFVADGNDMAPGTAQDNWESIKDLYPAANCNLTNKNRVNLVFDLANNANTQQNYFSCYTFMVRAGDNGDSEIYVSPTPSFFNLKEAAPTVDKTQHNNTFKVATSVNDTRMGTLKASTRYFELGDTVSFTITTSGYEENSTPYIGKLKQVTFGNTVITADKFATYGLTEDGGTYSVPITESMFDVAGKVLFISAEFEGSNTAVIAQGKTLDGGYSKVSLDNKTYADGPFTVEFGNTFYVKATANTGYKFVSWADGNTDATRTITIDANGKVGGVSYTANMITPVFREIVKYTFKVTTSATNGSITVTGGTDNGDGTYTVEEGKSLKFSQTPASGYQFVNWTVNSTTKTGSTYSYTPTNNNDLSVTANFEKIPEIYLYFKPHSYWVNKGLRYAVHFTKNSAWVDMTSVGNGIYRCLIPSGISSGDIIFVGMSASSTSNDWTYKICQTPNISWPTSGNNYYQLTSVQDWDGYGTGGTWSKYTP